MPGPEINEAAAWVSYRDHMHPHRFALYDDFGLGEPFVLADGEMLQTASGRRFVDFAAGFGAATLGHRPAPVVSALHRVLVEGPPFNTSIGFHDHSGPLARKLCSLAGGRFERVQFGTSGAEAIETALKFARAATGRDDVISLNGGFHGMTHEAVRLAGADVWRHMLSDRWEPSHLADPQDLNETASLLRGGRYAAVVVEVVQGLAGARVIDSDILLELQDLCRATGTVLIVDEVLTGIGRTGHWFAFQSIAGFEPDIVVCSKGLTGGVVPFSAVLMTREMHEAVFRGPETAMTHGGTFEAHVLGCVAALAVIDAIEAGQLLNQAAAFGDRLRDVFTSHNCPGVEIRGMGAFQALHFSPIGDYSSLELAQHCWICLIDNGYLTVPAAHAPEYLKLTPPFSISDQAIAGLVEVVTAVLADVRQSTEDVLEPTV